MRGYRSLAVYGAVAAYSFRRYSTYRIATAAGAFTNTVFGFIMAYTYIALWSQRPDLGGYDVTDAVTYVWLGQSMLMTWRCSAAASPTSSLNGSGPAL